MAHDDVEAVARLAASSILVRMQPTVARPRELDDVVQSVAREVDESSSNLWTWQPASMPVSSGTSFVFLAHAHGVDGTVLMAELGQSLLQFCRILHQMHGNAENSAVDAQLLMGADR